MRTGEVFTLPSVSRGYDRNDEKRMRRTVEQHFADLRADVVENRDTSDKVASLALRRHQFLLMGAR